MLIGTVEQLCEEVLARRERYGISSVTVFEKQREAGWNHEWEAGRSQEASTSVDGKEA